MSADQVGDSSESKRAWTAEDAGWLRAAWAMTGFPCALRALRAVERMEGEQPAEPDRSAA